MDVTVPPHNLRRLSSSIACLGKIGKDLYLSFDPLDGLTLSALNEAKSAYGRFHFDAAFFERCGAPPVVHRGGGNRGGGGSGGGGEGSESDEEFCDTRYVCRVPVRSVHSILRQRKGVVSLRIRSEGTDGEGNHFGLNRRKRKEHKRSRDRDRRNRTNDDEDEEEEERRGSFSARERRKRKRQKQSRLKKRQAENNDDNAEEDPNAMSRNTDKMMLSFEFFIERPAPDHALNPHAPIQNGGVFRVLHKVGVTDANGITLSASVAQRRTRSEIVAPPKLWMRLLDPLRRTAEVALTVDDALKVVTATSFHPGEVAQEGGRDNAVLQAAAARNAVLRTETSTGVEEFDEYDFRTNRGKTRRHVTQTAHSDSEGGSGNDAEDDPEKESDRPPEDVNEKVILVFSIKEAKAMLQYCAQTATAYDDGGVVLSFHWGGRPIVIETDGECFTGELVLATLHHGMIASNITVGGVGGG